MKNGKENDPFKDEIRKKLQEKSVSSENDSELWNKVLSQIRQEEPKILRISWGWYAAAASVVLVLVASTVFYFSSSSQPVTALQQQSNGNKDKVEKPHAADSVSPEVSSPEDETPIAAYKLPVPKSAKDNFALSGTPDFAKGKTVEAEQVLTYPLSDGSVATLNGGATLKVDEAYPSSRNLMLEGEAYFEVQPDKAHPFTVYFSGYKLIVVGTKFNVRNMADEDIKEVTVTEGIVRVFDKTKGGGIELRQGEQLRMAPGKNPVLSKVDSHGYIAWKTGSLDFKKTRFEDVVTILSRKFDKEIVLESQLKNCTFTGDFTSLNFEQALKIIKFSTSFEVQKANDKVYITGPGCD